MKLIVTHEGCAELCKKVITRLDAAANVLCEDIPTLMFYMILFLHDTAST